VDSVKPQSRWGRDEVLGIFATQGSTYDGTHVSYAVFHRPRSGLRGAAGGVPVGVDRLKRLAHVFEIHLPALPCHLPARTHKYPVTDSVSNLSLLPPARALEMHFSWLRVVLARGGAAPVGGTALLYDRGLEGGLFEETVPGVRKGNRGQTSAQTAKRLNAEQARRREQACKEHDAGAGMQAGRCGSKNASSTMRSRRHGTRKGPQ